METLIADSTESPSVQRAAETMKVPVPKVKLPKPKTVEFPPKKK